MAPGKNPSFIANKLLYLAFVDLEKAFDWVPRKVLGTDVFDSLQKCGNEFRGDIV